MADLRLVTYCGLFCDLCAQRCRIPSLAKDLRQAMAKEGYEYWGTQLAHFADFWAFLGQICDPDAACPGCRQGAGPEFCGIRKCARRHGVEVCPFCEGYPCQRVLELAKGYPTLISDGRRMCEIGLDRWVAEQQERARTGFAYADIRCHPYRVPEE
ncbi:MAG: DUF3795 domain-containing protein [Phycisphaerae bacterium]|nr:DUF3795 domain-containing protein [Phycisphaerae bacterium]